MVLYNKYNRHIKQEINNSNEVKKRLEVALTSPPDGFPLVNRLENELRQ